MPTVAGRLSFGTVGAAPGNKNVETANISIGGQRLIVCYQERDTSDVLLPRKSVAAPFFLKLKGQLWFICIARSEEAYGLPQEKLSGRIFIVSDDNRWPTQGRPILKNAQETMRKSDLSAGSSNHNVTSSLEAASRDISEISSFWVDFRLCRNGETTLCLNHNERFCANATRILQNAEKSHFYDLLCRQAFYFLKDICHRHQHHSPKTDTLADLYLFTDDISWRRDTLYALYRKIIHFKRNRTEDAVLDSMGTLAYAQSFHAICERNNKNHQLPAFDDESLTCSLEAAYKELTLEREIRRDRLSVFLAFIFGIIGCLLALLSLLQITDAKIGTPNPYLVAVAVALLRNTIDCLSLFFAGVVLIWTRPWYSSLFYNFIRFLQPMGQYRAAFVCFVFALSFGTILFALLLI